MTKSAPSPESGNATCLPPGGWVGVVGGGQLGWMFCRSAQQLGYRVAVLDPDPFCPASSTADLLVPAAYADPAALDVLAGRCMAVTIEFENLPAESLRRLEPLVWVRPSASSVAVTQNRILEKQFLQQCGLPVAPHCVLGGPQSLAALSRDAISSCLPGILKTAQFGYDGRGQHSISDWAQWLAFFAADPKRVKASWVLEQRLPLLAEVSVILARSAGQMVFYPLSYNVHHEGILAYSLIPGQGGVLEERARQMAATVAEQLDYTGVLCVEFFVLKNAQGILELCINEVAPRPHNSGHYTLDACNASQFEQQVRALVGLPLAPVSLHSAAVMLNILGEHDRFLTEETPYVQLLSLPGVHVHNYQKQDARPGRKMGHVTFTGRSWSEVYPQAQQAAALLGLDFSDDHVRYLFTTENCAGG